MEAKIKISVAALIFCAGLARGNFALAGTTQIYSPAGLPRSSSQDYSIPDTTIPAQTFPTPPIPLVDIGMQSFSTIPLKSEINTNIDKSKGVDNRQDKIQPIPDNNDVDSLFQLAPAPTNKGNLDKIKLGPAGRVIWHILDNFGVPMFIGKDSDLDPSLRINVQAQPENSCSKTNVNSVHQKIPDSELEGTDLPIRDNAKL